ncbi:MAG: transposase [Polyangiaceae bacterium]
MSKSPAGDAKVELLEGLKGIGRVTALTLLSAVLELGKLTESRCCGLVGVAPLACDSGKQSGLDACGEAEQMRERVQSMATLVARDAMRLSEHFYQQLSARVCQEGRSASACANCSRLRMPWSASTCARFPSLLSVEQRNVTRCCCFSVAPAGGGVAGGLAEV